MATAAHTIPPLLPVPVRVTMTDLTIKNIPDDLLARLCERAADEGRDLNSHILAALEADAARDSETPVERIARLRAFRERFSHLPPLTQEFLDEARAEGRE